MPGVLYARVAGAWVPVSAGPAGPAGPPGPAGPSGVIAPAYAGPAAVVPADARFGLIGAVAGFCARAGLLFVDLAGTSDFVIAGPPTGEIVKVKAADPTYPSSGFVGAVNVSGAGACYVYKGGRQGVPATDIVTYVDYGAWNLWHNGVNLLAVNVSNGWTVLNGQMQANIAATAPWNTVNFIANSAGGSIAAYSATVPGLAPQWRCTTATSEAWQAYNNAGSGYIAILASAFTVSSAADTKVDVRALRPEREHIVVRSEPLVDEVAAPDVMGLRPVVYRPKVIGQRIVPTDGDSYDSADPDSWTWEDHPPGSPVDVQNRRERLGLVADEVQHVVPSAVMHDVDGNPIGIDYAQITVALLDHVQELTRTVETLRYRITELEGRP